MAAKPRVLVLRAPGTNCDVETAFAFEKAGGIAERIHVLRLVENPHLLRQYQILCIPGGLATATTLLPAASWPPNCGFTCGRRLRISVNRTA